MEQSEQKRSGSRRNRQELIALVKKFEKSEGITVKAFCALHNIGEGAFYSFRKRYYHKRAKPEKPTGFIKIRPTAAEGKPGILFAEVKGIRLYQPVSADYLKALAS
jgi:hypothetical protein